MPITLREFTDQEAFIDAITHRFDQAVHQALSQRERASVVFSGGTTPKLFLPALSCLNLPWHRIYLTLADERWVSADSPDSNERMLRDYLLQGPAERAHFFPLQYEAMDAIQGAMLASQALQDFPEPIDLLLLGMGEDGHTLSWFPDAPDLAKAIDPSVTTKVVAIHPRTVTQARLSLTLSMALKAKEIFLHIQGEKKKEVLRSALDGLDRLGNDWEWPIQVILRQQAIPITIFWCP